MLTDLGEQDRVGRKLWGLCMEEALIRERAEVLREMGLSLKKQHVVDGIIDA